MTGDNTIRTHHSDQLGRVTIPDNDPEDTDYCADCGHNHTGPCADDATSGIVAYMTTDADGTQMFWHPEDVTIVRRSTT